MNPPLSSADNPKRAPIPYPAFLSSLTSDLKDLRKGLHAALPSLLWVAEYDYPELNPEAKEPLEIVDALLEQLKLCDLFICVLGGNRNAEGKKGTPIQVSTVSSQVSYFEIEVFQAALHRIPAIFLKRSDFVPSPDLAGFLELLRGCAIEARWIENLSNNQIKFEVERAIGEREELRAASQDRISLAAGELAERLLRQRGNLKGARPGQSDMLFLQGKELFHEHSNGSFDKAKTLLASASRESRHDHRLARLYLALRELMSMPDRHSEDSELLLLWNDLLDMWWGSAAWYGLHNHLSMGALGALSSQLKIRDRLSIYFPKEKGFRPPLGSLASAYFSLSKLVLDKQLQVELCDTGISLSTEAIKLYGNEDPGIYAVRGSLLYIRGRHSWALWDFLRLYFLALRQPKNHRLNAEARSYLGKAFVKMRMHSLGESHLNESAHLWRQIVLQEGNGKEFLIKTLKNLIELHLTKRNYDKALSVAHEAAVLIEELKAVDQKNQIEAMLRKAALPYP